MPSVARTVTPEHNHGSHDGPRHVRVGGVVVVDDLGRGAAQLPLGVGVDGGAFRALLRQDLNAVAPQGDSLLGRRHQPAADVDRAAERVVPAIDEREGGYAEQGSRATRSKGVRQSGYVEQGGVL